MFKNRCILILMCNYIRAMILYNIVLTCYNLFTIHAYSLHCLSKGALQDPKIEKNNNIQIIYISCLIDGLSLQYLTTLKNIKSHNQKYHLWYLIQRGLLRPHQFWRKLNSRHANDDFISFVCPITARKQKIVEFGRQIKIWTYMG